MNQDWRSALRRLFMFTGLAAVIGWVLDILPWALAGVFLGYLIWQLLQLRKLQNWLTNRSADEPPTSRGLWGNVFDDAYRLQRRNTKAQNRLKAVLNRVQDSTAALKDGVLMVDSNGNLEWWNHAAARLLGLQEQSDVGQPITNLVRDPSFKEYFEKIDGYDDPLDMTAPSNPDISVQFHITLFGRKDRLILCQDITRMKHLEDMRQDFVANVSHELRTPLTVISGYLETFLDNRDMLPPRWGRALEQMHQQGYRMQNLVNDLLTLSRLETTDGRDPISVPVPTLLRSILQEAEQLSGDKNHKISLECEDINVQGMDNELSSAFSNLVFNAVKYTPAEGEINIRWYQDKNGLHMSVTDDGIGIDIRHIPRLTERFYRADPSRHAETGGTGLGLAIVKHVMIRHEGSLAIQSRVGQGSTFTCHFPLHRKAEATKAQWQENVG